MTFSTCVQVMIDFYNSDNYYRHKKFTMSKLLNRYYNKVMINKVTILQVMRYLSILTFKYLLVKNPSIAN